MTVVIGRSRHVTGLASLRLVGGRYIYMNIALRRFLHNHDNIATEGSPKPGVCPTLISNDFQGSLYCTVP